MFVNDIVSGRPARRSRVGDLLFIRFMRQPCTRHRRVINACFRGYRRPVAFDACPFQRYNRSNAYFPCTRLGDRLSTTICIRRVRRIRWNKRHACKTIFFLSVHRQSIKSIAVAIRVYLSFPFPRPPPTTGTNTAPKCAVTSITRRRRI